MRAHYPKFTNLCWEARYCSVQNAVETYPVLLRSSTHASHGGSGSADWLPESLPTVSSPTLSSYMTEVKMPASCLLLMLPFMLKHWWVMHRKSSLQRKSMTTNTEVNWDSGLCVIENCPLETGWKPLPTISHRLPYVP